MFQRLIFSALIAGLLAGLIVSALHQITTVPLIVAAEEYENQSEEKKAAYNTNGPLPIILVHGNAHSNEETSESWAPNEGLERTLWTVTTTLLTAIGFALLLTAGFAISRQEINGRTGVMWGIAGFTALSLAPALGLPPELPGSSAAELVARQSWWVLTVSATIAGIALLCFSKNWVLRALAIALVMTPHAIGAPHPTRFESLVPGELSGLFVANSLGTSFIFWCLLGWLSGTIYNHFYQLEEQRP